VFSAARQAQSSLTKDVTLKRSSNIDDEHGILALTQATASDQQQADCRITRLRTIRDRPRPTNVLQAK
jgi:hypothetical protein